MKCLLWATTRVYLDKGIAGYFFQRQKYLRQFFRFVFVYFSFSAGKMILKGIFPHPKLSRIVRYHRQRRIATGAFVNVQTCVPFEMKNRKMRFADARDTRFGSTFFFSPNFRIDWICTPNIWRKFETWYFLPSPTPLTVSISFLILHHTHVLFRFIFALSGRIAWTAAVREKNLFFLL